VGGELDSLGCRLTQGGRRRAGVKSQSKVLSAFAEDLASTTAGHLG
jgi:hypothetical protein